MDNLQNENSPLQGFEALESFISSFLLCDDHQLTILTLWVANTWCFSRFHTIPYLDIRSPESQCGKWQQQCAEPLLRLANMIGGPWPARARAALLAAFGVAEYGNQVQVLRDIRDLFLLNKQPEKLPTRDLLSYLRNLEDRPWTKWPSNSRHHLSNLLRPFGIFSCDIKVEGASLKGYRLHDFQEAWERYAGPVAISRDHENSIATS